MLYVASLSNIFLIDNWLVLHLINKAKLLWCCRRGILELDLILHKFAQIYLEQLNAQQLIIFDKLLAFADADLYDLLMGYVLPKEQDLIEFVKFIRSTYCVK